MARSSARVLRCAGDVEPRHAGRCTADVYSPAKTLWVLLSRQSYPLPREQRREVEGLRISSYVVLRNGAALDQLIDNCTRNDPKAPSAGEVRERLRCAAERVAPCRPNRAPPINTAGRRRDRR